MQNFHRVHCNIKFAWGQCFGRHFPKIYRNVKISWARDLSAQGRAVFGTVLMVIGIPRLFIFCFSLHICLIHSFASVFPLILTVTTIFSFCVVSVLAFNGFPYTQRSTR